MLYLCPKCDKGMSSEEVLNGQCLHCKARFDFVGKKPEKSFNPNLFLKKIVKDIDGAKVKKINYGESAIDMIKAVMPEIVLARRGDYLDFFLVRDCEITSFLFRLINSALHVRIEFDTLLNGVKGVVPLTEYNIRKVNKGLKSVLMTKDFEYMLDVCCSVHARKKYKPTKMIGKLGIQMHLPVEYAGKIKDKIKVKK